MTQNEDSLKPEYSVSMRIERLDVIWKIAQKPAVLPRLLHFDGFAACDLVTVVSKTLFRFTFAPKKGAEGQR